MPVSMQSSSTLAYSPRRARLRLSAGLDPFGLILTRFAGPRRHPHHRLGQHRRDQRAAHRPQGPRGRDAAGRRAEGHRRGARSRSLLGTGRGARSRRSAPSSATPSRSGSASRAARASRPSSAGCSASSLVGGACFRARSGSRSPSSPATPRCRRSSRARRRRSILWSIGQPDGGARSVVLAAPALVEAPRKHPPAPRRDRRPDRAEGDDADDPHRRAAPRLAPADPVRKCRAAHLPRPHQPLRRRRRGARGAAGPRPARRAATSRCRPAAEAEARDARRRRGSASLRRASASRIIRRRLQAIDTRAAPHRRARARRHACARPSVAIVGSRNASAVGPDLRRALAAAARRGGLRRRLGPGARHRHRAPTGRALASGHGRGAGGRPRPDLSGRARAAAREASLAAGGAVDRPRCRWAGSRAAGTSRAATGSSPGLSLGVVVVEAARRSGLADHGAVRRWSRAERSSRCRARRSIRAPRARTTF